MKNLLRAVSIVLLAATMASAGQQKVWYGQPLAIDATISEVGLQTKYTVTFKNRGNLTVTDLKVQRVGISILYRDFCPAYYVPAIKPGKTFTLNVYCRGHIAAAGSDEAVVVTGTYRSGRESVIVNRAIKIYCN